MSLLLNKWGGMNLQPIVTLIAAFVGAWLANLNFNKQKKNELISLKLNVNEEIKDIRGELQRAIPLLVKSYDSMKDGVLTHISDVKLPRKNEFFILPIALDKIYAQLHPQRRKVFKIILALEKYLSERHDKINDTFKAGAVLHSDADTKDVLALANEIRLYVISMSIFYFYINACCEHAESVAFDDLNDKEVFDKVIRSLNLHFSFYG